MTIEDHNDREAKLLAERKERRREYMREYARKWAAENPEKVKESYRKINKARKVKEDEAFRIKFEAERERERQIHQQMKAAQLRRSIMRNGEIPDHTITIADMTDVVRYVSDHVPTCIMTIASRARSRSDNVMGRRLRLSTRPAFQLN
jgi:hypothetical protein